MFYRRRLIEELQVRALQPLPRDIIIDHCKTKDAGSVGKGIEALNLKDDKIFV